MMLNVSGLCVRYSTTRGDIQAVSEVSFEIPDGQSIGIAGESACGKSTLGMSILRVLDEHITSGTIHLDGQSILDISDFDKTHRWKKISMIFQGAMNSLDPVFCIRDQLEEILSQHGFSGDTQKTISDALEQVHLEKSILDKFPHELSGGMKQRIVIAMALLLEPKLIIADEPTTALDVLIQAQIINLLKDLKKQGVSFVFITHDLSVLSEIADKIGIMYAGQMIEFGDSEQIYTKPKHPYTQGLLNSIPTLHGDKPTYIKGTPPSLINPPSRCRFYDRCPHAFEKCNVDPPDFKTRTGYVKCWLYE